MNNSKKRVGKVVAIAMASAMAMSSLSAALVTASAYSDPALTSSGTLELKENADFNNIMTGLVDDTMDLVIPAGPTGEFTPFDLMDANRFTDAKVANLLQYKDSNGRTIGVDVDKITWSIVSGGTYLSVGNKDGEDLKAKKADNNKAGRSTLRMTVKAKVDLGGKGDDEKTVTYTHDFNVNVYKDGETYLEAFSGAPSNTNKLNLSDLNDLAAYGETLQFSAVKVAGDASGFLTNVNPVSDEDARFYAGNTAEIFDYNLAGQGTEDVERPDTTVTKAQVVDAVYDALGRSSDTDKMKAKVKKAISDLLSDPTASTPVIVTAKKEPTGNAFKLDLPSGLASENQAGLDTKYAVGGLNVKTANLGSAPTEYVETYDPSADALYFDASQAATKLYAIAGGADVWTVTADGTGTAKVNLGSDPILVTATDIVKYATATGQMAADITISNINGAGVTGVKEVTQVKTFDTFDAFYEAKLEDKGAQETWTTVLGANELLELVHDETYTTGKADLEGKLKKGSKSSEKNTDISITSGPRTLVLKTNGEIGTSTVKVEIDGEEYSLDVKTTKAVRIDGMSPTIKKSGSKTLLTGVSDASMPYGMDAKTNIAGFALKNQGTTGSVTVESGTVGNIYVKDTNTTGSISISGGKVGNIDAQKINVTLTDDPTVGNIDAKDVVVGDDAVAAKIVTYNNGIATVQKGGQVDSIDAEGKATVSGGTVKGDVKSSTAIEISAKDTDEDDNAIDTFIGGNVIAASSFAGADFSANQTAKIDIENDSEDGEATVTVNGNVISRFSNSSEATVEVGTDNTTGPIRVSGYLQGENVKVGGQGLVSFSALKGTDEVDYDNGDGEIVDSTIEFAGFNGTVNNINGFQYVKVSTGTATVDSAISGVTELTVDSDCQLVAKAGISTEDISGDGQIVTEAGKLKISGDVNDQPVLIFTGDTSVGKTLYTAPRNKEESFDLRGLTVKSQKIATSDYAYNVTKAELFGLDAIGKDANVVIGGTTQLSVQVGPTSATLPEGAKIVWSSSDEDIVEVTGEGTTATIKGVDTGSDVEITAKIVDANGRELGYENATFNVGVTDKTAVEIKLDTVEKTIAAGQVYGFRVTGNRDAQNIQVSISDPEVAKVELVDGTNEKGAVYNITGLKAGSATINVTYQGATSSIKLTVLEYSMTLDTANYTMPHGGAYEVGVTIMKNGTRLTGAEVKQMIASGELNVSMSRGGAVATFSVTDKGHILVMGKNINGRSVDGTEWLMVKAMKDGKEINRSSIGITVKAGAAAGGSAEKNTSIW